MTPPEPTEQQSAVVIPSSRLAELRVARDLARRALNTIAASGAQPPPVCPHCGRVWHRSAS